jgi:DDE superfamily endonuclease
MIAALDVRQLKCIDESGVNLAMTRLYGRAPTGERVVGSVPQNYGQHITILGALSARGGDAVMTVEGATDAMVFRTYLKEVLGPTLSPGDIVVMDNLGAHKATGIQQMLARRLSALSAALLARSVSHRAVLVEAQNRLAYRESTDPGGAGASYRPRLDDDYGSGCARVVPPLWLYLTLICKPL